MGECCISCGYPLEELLAAGIEFCDCGTDIRDSNNRIPDDEVPGYILKEVFG